MVHNIFRHSGKIGDIIYALPTIKALGGGILYLNLSYEFTKDAAKSLIPLLRHQTYIVDCKVWKNEEFKYDLDRFREKKIQHKNLCYAHLEAFQLNNNLKNQIWLEILKPIKRDIIISRSFRYTNTRIDWKPILNFIKDRAIFLGLEEEYNDFKYRVGNIPFVQTRNLLEAARYIAGCKIFIGNQSALYAIAEGLKKNTIQESCIGNSNCVFNRPNALYLWDKIKEVDLLKWELSLNHG